MRLQQLTDGLSPFVSYDAVARFGPARHAFVDQNDDDFTLGGEIDRRRPQVRLLGAVSHWDAWTFAERASRENAIKPGGHRSRRHGFPMEEHLNAKRHAHAGPSGNHSGVVD